MSTPSIRSVKDLLPQFETAQANLDAADGVLTTKTEKLNTAKAEFSTAVSSDNDAITAYNDVADQIAAAIIASKRTPVSATEPAST